jgi:PAS domain S-box-containing protein
MSIELRKTGISIVDDAPWGTHFCTFYETKQDLLDILVPYFKTGLENKEFCLWIVSNSELITTDEAEEALGEAVSDLDRYLAEGRIEIVSHDQWFLKNGVFDFHRVAYGFKEKLDEALANGYAGLRINGSPAWIHAEDAKVLREFEAEADHFFADEHIIASCTYPLAGSRADFLLDVARNHQFAIARRQGKWEVLETPQLIQAKQEIQRLNDELEQRVLERTTELAVANEELRLEITEHKRAEALLYSKEQEFRAIVENAPDQIIRYDRNFRRAYVNPAVARAYGLPREALIGKPIGSVIEDAGLDVKEDELTQLRQQIQNVFDSGRSYEYELNWPLPTGRKYFSVRLFPELDLDGSVVNVLGISRDITERKQTEEALDERLCFETLVTELSAAFANLSPNEVDREIDKWLQTLVEFLGVDRASFFQFGEDWTTLYRSHSYTVPGIEPLPRPPIDLKNQFPWIADQLRQGVTVKWSRIPDDMPEEAAKEKEFVARLGVKSSLNIPVVMGGSVNCAITFTSIANYHDWPDAMVARLRLAGEIFAAAVERKRAEAALRKSEKQFRQMAENIREVFWLATIDLSKILYVSPAYETVWGQSCESLYREPRAFFAAIHAEDRSRVNSIIEGAREQGFEVEYRVVRPDGSIRCIRDRGFPIKDESGHFYRVAGIAEDITERKRAEDELTKEKEVLKKIFDNIPLLIGFVGEDDRVKLVNPEWERSMGWTLKELQDQNVDIFAEAYPDLSYRQEVLDFVASSTGEWADLKIKVRDGRVIDAACAVVHLSDGTRIAIAQDITERKQAEERLKQSENQLAEAQRLANIGSWTLDLRSNTVTWSDELYRIFGVQQSEFDHNYEAVIRTTHPEDRDWLKGVIEDAVNTHRPFSVYYRITKPTGEQRVLHARGAVVTDEHRNATRLHGTAQDVTERKQAEQALREAEQNYRDIFENAGEGIFQSTPEGRYIAANPALARMYGFAFPEELIQSLQDISLQVYVDPRRREEFKRQLEEEGSVRGFEHEVFRRDGSRLWISVNARAVRGEQGEIQYYEGTARDITERKAAEEKLKATSEQLRKLSAKLQSAREEEATRIARELHDELGSTLTSLRWGLDEIDNTLSKTSAKSNANTLRSKIATMTSLVEGTLNTIRRISSELRPGILDEVGLLAAIRWEARQFEARTGIICDFESSIENAPVSREQSIAIFRIFQEALTNILRHASATRVGITMNGDGDEFVLTIRDDGRGITAQESSGQYSLGILGMRERAHLIEGEIDIQGVEGKGTVIVLRVPISDA